MINNFCHPNQAAFEPAATMRPLFRLLDMTLLVPRKNAREEKKKSGLLVYRVYILETV
jgi:hypothetical protein